MNTYILGLETSCDETSAAVVKNGKIILSNIIVSQSNLHKKFGGIVPEIASRKHVENILYVINKALLVSKIKKEELSAIGVTNCPGLIGSLLVGLTCAKALSYSLNIPIIPVNHLRGHIYANVLEHNLPQFPMLALIVSGGHTVLSYWKNHKNITIIGQTLDDSAGEVFDKIARQLGFSYPGGPEIERISKHGNELKIKFPVAKLEKNSLNFSFSGLKSNVLNYIYKQNINKNFNDIKDCAASFQFSIFKALEEKIFQASIKYNIKNIVLAGGVISNKMLWKYLNFKIKNKGIKLFKPSSVLCTDNGAMIAAAAYYLLKEKKIGNHYTNAFSRINNELKL